MPTTTRTDPSPVQTSAPNALEVRGVSKSYDGIAALVDVDLVCEPGAVHALVGANGSGKSTLLGIAAGARTADTGTVHIGGDLLESASPRLAHDLGLAAVYQDNSHVSGLSVAQNLYLAVPGLVRPAYSDRHRWATGVLRRHELDIDPRTALVDLEPAKRQLLEVVKAFALEPRVVLLDEPTTALSAREVDLLHRLIRRLTERGAGVVYVSHRLPEVFGLADRVTVLRDGRSCGTFDRADLDESRVVELMLGVPVELEFPAKAPAGDRPVVLRAEDLTGEGLGPLSLTVRAGEVVGIAGAEGNGQRQLVRALAGVERVGGRLERDGRRVRTGSVGASLRSGTMLLSGDRARESVFADLSVRENMMLQVLGRFSRFGMLRRRPERAEARRLVDELKIKTPHIEREINTLSGGNQQKAVISRSFTYPADVIIVDEPTQGVDAGARLDIFRAIRGRAEQGAAVVVNASDASELEGLCDRVVVMSRGEIVRELSGPEVTEAAIVESFLTVDSARAGPGHVDPGDPTGRVRRGLLGSLRDPAVTPLMLLVGLIVCLAVYTNSDNPNFLSGTNIGFTLTNLVPIALIAVAQLNVLLVRGFDVSVGAVMSLSVVLSSVLISPGNPIPDWVAVAVILAVGGAVGLLNVVLVRGFRIPSIIATLATLSIVQGIALRIRPVVGEPIDRGYRDAMSAEVGVVPVALFVIVGIAVIGDLVLYRTGAGVRLRSTGFAEESARRVGVRTEWVHLRAYVSSGVLAAAAGLFVGVNIGNGDPTAGSSFILISFAACVLGGASLLGGRGTFIGAVLGALLLAVIDKMPGFLELNAALGEILTGALTLAAIVLYSSTDAAARAVGAVRRRVSPSTPVPVAAASKGSP